MVAVCAGLAGLAVRASAQTGSAFSYQGRVTESGAPMNGTVNVQLSLWKDAFSLDAADRIGSVQFLNNVPVSNGVFTVVGNSLNEFGVNPFTGQAIWLMVAVNGVNQLPRNQILSVPYASGLAAGGGAQNNSSGTTTLTLINESSSSASTAANTLKVRRGALSGISLGTFYPAAVLVDSGNGNGIISTNSTNAAYAIFGYASGSDASGVVGRATGTNAFGVQGIGDGTGSIGVVALSSTATGTALRATATGAGGTAIRAIANNGSSANGVWATVSGSFGAALYGTATGPSGVGLLASSSGANGKAVYASTSGGASHAGYFLGNVYASGWMGVGVEVPTTPLDVQVASGQRLQIRLDEFVPGINVNNAGGNAGIMRLRNAMEIWPSDDGTRAGKLDIRNAAGTQTIVMNGANGSITATGTITPSSGRLKENVVPMSDALARLLALDGVRFDWTPEEASKRGGKMHDIGFIAEKVAMQFPEVVFRDEAGNVIGMDYARMSAVAVQAIKEQQAQREADRKAIERLEDENKELRLRLERLEAMIEKR